MARLSMMRSALLSVAAFAAAANASAFIRQAAELGPAANASLPVNWTYIGCYNDTTAQRTLNGSSYDDNKGMNGSSCAAYCNTNNYIYAGTEWGQQCFCGQEIGPLSSLQNDTSCQQPCTGNSSEACGDSNFLSVYFAHRKAPQGPQVNPGPANWTSYGCWEDSGNPRTLNHENPDNIQFSNMTVDLCLTSCGNNGYTLGGLEYSGQCFCDNYLNGSPKNVTIDQCDMTCNGNSSEFCGAGNRLNLYASGTTIPGPKNTSADVPRPLNWVPQGCYNDSVNARVLSHGEAVPGGANNMTNYNCINTCMSLGYNIAGTEYSGECYCDNSFQNGGAPVTDGRCSMTCNGNANDICGGPNGLSVFAFDLWYPQGCWEDNNGGRTLSQYLTNNVPGGSDNMTVENCVATCKAAGYSLAGLEYAGECWCDNAPNYNEGPASDGAAQCTMPCKGNQNEMCGGPNRLDVYRFNNSALYTATTSSSSSVASISATTTGTSSGTTSLTATMSSDNATATSSGVTSSMSDNSTITSSAATVSSTSSTNSTSSESIGSSSVTDGNPNITMTTTTMSSMNSSTSTSATATVATNNPNQPLNTSGILPFKYQGCYTDTSNQGRSLTYNFPDNQNLTIEMCIQNCTSQGYTIAGMQYSIQCFCDNYLHNSPQKVDDSNCNMACGGDSQEECGSGGHNSIYSNGTAVDYIPPMPLTTGLPENWTYTGCFSDNVNNSRVLPYMFTFPNNNSNTYCITLCNEYGYGVAATEYAEQCFCGDTLDYINAGSTMIDNSTCSQRCTNDTAGSNGGELCGGGNALSLYTYNAPAKNQWTFATGDAAGAYEFLIGGVTIPLLTSPSRNGKVVFLEKFGTGPGNDTGAYELDLATLDNFTAAWRPMHVKTDIFCSAGVTLPDRAGRHLNVGGWATPSTEGIRLYWPDGSPGVWGTNDWQENVDEVHLLTGRWYPSAMVMANGSILVMGGEKGSNGAPVPNLEILPSPSGELIYCDFLNRTDPYNLYPFMVNMPSGNIFVAYYNEARLLDPNTLETVSVLPNIPGAVNNFLAGRTYPLEGTGVIMPQYPPYTDDIEILICGGSIPGPAVALDNCVTIAPDSPNANWTIERMPSKRVMPCIAPLPDGTYIIANGAQQGTAGFGLATDPNLNALLYDPTKPVGQRITVMANTTVARLYHSEAILLDDGRVLISGSDPEDNVHPEEYRVEVFVPPYLMNNPTRPAFNVTNQDWSYGEQVTLTITAPGAGGNYRVSMLGAISSTHGNSMGQRTFFLDASCGGGTCTVTAPPNANVCPPGWFQLFLLDSAGVPAIANWVRVGGDPAMIGNWPNATGFDVPGMGAVQRIPGL